MSTDSKPPAEPRLSDHVLSRVAQASHCLTNSLRAAHKPHEFDEWLSQARRQLDQAEELRKAQRG